MIDYDVDFVLAEFFAHVEEIELCIETIKRANKPIAATMRIGPLGDSNGVSVEECAVRMAKAGAQIVGINCLYDIHTQLKVIKRMKAALDKEGLKPYLMIQALGWLCPEVEDTLAGYLALPETPLDLDSRCLTRSEMHQFARDAWNAGVHYIGGCCGIEPHLIRAISQELAVERGRNPPVDDMAPAFSKFLGESMITYNKVKAENRDFWMNLRPASGRPKNPAMVDIDVECRFDVDHM
jgi:betaine-homocysteine S-methyltransferase